MTHSPWAATMLRTQSFLRYTFGPRELVPTIVNSQQRNCLHFMYCKNDAKGGLGLICEISPIAFDFYLWINTLTPNLLWFKELWIMEASQWLYTTNVLDSQPKRSGVWSQLCGVLLIQPIFLQCILVLTHCIFQLNDATLTFWITFLGQLFGDKGWIFEYQMRK